MNRPALALCTIPVPTRHVRFWPKPAGSPSTHPESVRPEASAGDAVETGVQPDDAAGQLGQRRQPVLGQDELLQAGQQAEGVCVCPGDGIAAQVYSLQLLWRERKEEMGRDPHRTVYPPCAPMQSLALPSPQRTQPREIAGLDGADAVEAGVEVGGLWWQRWDVLQVGVVAVDGGADAQAELAAGQGWGQRQPLAWHGTAWHNTAAPSLHSTPEHRDMDVPTPARTAGTQCPPHPGLSQPQHLPQPNSPGHLGKELPAKKAANK